MRLSFLASIATLGFLLASGANAQSPNAACTGKCVRAYTACIKLRGGCGGRQVRDAV